MASRGAKMALFQAILCVSTCVVPTVLDKINHMCILPVSVKFGEPGPPDLGSLTDHISIKNELNPQVLGNSLRT